MTEKRKPLVQLTDKQIADLKKVQIDVPQAKIELAALKRLGLDTTDLEEKLAWGEEVANTLLETFT